MLPYPERRENDPREHREAGSFVACSGCPNFGRFNSTCWAAQFGVVSSLFHPDRSSRVPASGPRLVVDRVPSVARIPFASEPGDDVVAVVAAAAVVPAAVDAVAVSASARVCLKSRGVPV